MTSRQRRTSRLVRHSVFAASALLAVSSLGLSARAQLYFPPLMRKVVPTAAAAQLKAVTENQPIWQVMVKFRKNAPTDAEQFARQFSTTFSARAAEAQLVRAGLAQPGGNLNAPALTYKFSLEEIGWHVYRLPSPNVVGETLAALRKRPDVLLAVADNPTSLLIEPPTNPKWNAYADEFLFSLLLQNYGGYNGDDINPFLPPSEQGGISGGGLFGSILTRAARYYDSATWKYNWHLDTIKAQDAWGVFPTYYPTAAQMKTLPASQRPLVAVLDTGVDMNNPAFRAPGGVSTHANDGGMIQRNLARSFHLGNNGDNPGAPGYNPNPELAMDVFGHGTSVAGLIGAAANTNFGLPGVGITCRIVPVRIYGANGDGNDSDLLRGIRYAVNAGCVVINVSARTNFGWSPAFQDAVNYAWEHNAVVVAAIGNDGKNTVEEPNFKRYPASLARVLAVGGSVWAGEQPRGTYHLEWDGYDEEGNSTHYSEDIPYTGTYFVNELNASYSNYGNELGVVAPAGDGMFFENNAPAQTGDPSETDNLIWQYLMQSLASPPPSGIGLPLGAVPEFMHNYTVAPTYTVPMNDPTNPSFGAYAAFNLYHQGYGAVPGTSFASPVVAGLAALYAAKMGITQSTTGGAQQILSAIQRGCDDIFLPTDDYRPDNNSDGFGHFFKGGWSVAFGYGRINAAATLNNLNKRNATVGGVVGLVARNGVPTSGIRVDAIRSGYGSPVAVITGTDGVYRLRNLTQGVWEIKATGLSGTPISRNVTIVPGADLQAVDFTDARSTVSGTVTMQNVVEKNQPITFTFKAFNGGTDKVVTQMLSATGTFSIPNLDPGQYHLGVKGAKWLRRVVDVNASAGDVSGVTVSLLGGDGNNDNVANVTDLLQLISVYNTVRGGQDYQEAFDFTCNGTVDISDLLVLISNYNKFGDAAP